MNISDIIKAKAKEHSTHYGESAYHSGARQAFCLAADWMRRQAEKLYVNDCDDPQVEASHRIADAISDMARGVPVPEKPGPRSWLKPATEMTDNDKRAVAEFQSTLSIVNDRRNMILDLASEMYAHLNSIGDDASSYGIEWRKKFHDITTEEEHP